VKVEGRGEVTGAAFVFLKNIRKRASSPCHLATNQQSIRTETGGNERMPSSGNLFLIIQE